VQLSADLWAHAVLLGAARQRRGGGSQRADRGRHNAHVDLMGAFADLVFTDADTGSPVGIDANTFDCDRDKRYFAINDGKHKALRGSCQAYFCALARPFGRFAAIARLVPCCASGKESKTPWRNSAPSFRSRMISNNASANERRRGQTWGLARDRCER
jgi:hypothetical protein